mgnify:CR=1 FL=1
MYRSLRTLRRDQRQVCSEFSLALHWHLLSTEFETKITKVQSNRVRRVVSENLVFRNHRSSSMVHHMGGTAARTPSGTKAVTTIYDLQFLEYPENFSVPKKLFLGKAVPAAI